jgi:O-antigen/teichoic acid export membrane protein
VQWKRVKELFNYGKYSFGTSLGAMVFGSIDQWMLGALHSPSAAGAYNIAIRITNLVEVPTGTVARIVFPQSAKRMETEGKAGIKYLYEKSVGTILALLIPGLLFLFIFSDYVVDFLAGEKYDDAVPILHVTILFCLFVPFARQFGTIMDSIGKPKLNFTLTIIMAAVNVAMNFIFIRWLGVIGAAYATLTSYAVGFVIGQSILRKQLDVNFLNAFVYAVKFYPEFFSKHFRLVRKAG